MLTIRCAKCKTKLFKYKKIGQGQVLRCYKDRIEPLEMIIKNGSLLCVCKNVVGIEMDSHFKMKTHQFIYTGRKENS